MAAEQRLPGRRRAVLHVVAVGDGHEIEQSAAIKTSTSETLVAAGGTITHHHAVGKTHLPAIGIRSESGLDGEFGTAYRIRTGDLRLERAVS